MNITKDGVIKYFIGLLAFALATGMMLIVDPNDYTNVESICTLLIWYTMKWIINELLTKLVYYVADNFDGITLFFAKRGL